ncbi:DUF2059 domain-containing protein [Paragemmobacter ruber]|uniref:DUF2059 domain-containing protein n=1 Tax=Paragemmobacter ruber TaxID=1985673 RepID=A0ABW9YAN0_9RHOB|nr:DUF2059 domain-containing protein [Rhodobacter ruber]NBE09498.1 DUF2059 domain-containing protein [Rhodobacter ruber]
METGMMERGRPGAAGTGTALCRVARAGLLAMALVGAVPTGILPPSAAWAQEATPDTAEAATAGVETVDPAVVAQVAALVETMKIADIVAILREEGVEYGRTLQADMFPDAGGQGWEASVSMIYDTARMQEALVATVTRELAQAPQAIAEMQAFFGSDLGQKVLSLEVEARRTLLDDAAEEAARIAWEDLAAGGTARVDLLERFAAANDLIESNVMGALNANLAFYSGMQEGGAFGGEMTEEQMLTDVWAQEADVRQQTTEWLYSYLTLAYGPLTDEELEQYLAFSESDAGRALNAALFAAFDDVFTPISRALGVAVARQLQGQDI